MKHIPDAELIEIKRLIRQAAQLATAHSLKSQEFVLAAFNAFLECNPQMRARLEQEQMREEFDAARRQGKLALA